MIQSPLPQTYLLLLGDHNISMYHLGRGGIKAYSCHAVAATEGGLAATLAAVRRQYPYRGDDTLVVGLPMRYFNEVNFTLPAAAAANLEQAVRYELLRHLPFDPQQAWQHVSSVASADQLTISVTLAAKQPLQPLLAALGAAGLAPTSLAPALPLLAALAARDGVYVAGDAGQIEALLRVDSATVCSAVVADDCQDDAIPVPLRDLFSHVTTLTQAADPLPLWYWLQPPPPCFSAHDGIGAGAEIDIASPGLLERLKQFDGKIDLIEPRQLQRQQRWVRVQLAMVVLVIVSLALLPYAWVRGRSAALEHLQRQIVVVKQRAQALDAIRRENQQITSTFEQLATYRDHWPCAVDVLKEVTDILPQDTWLSSLTMHEQRLTMRGTSADATRVVEALENSPLISAVHFDAPVVKRGDKETFTIVATLSTDG